MKKTLIALAAVAVSTGAMAQAHNQATISGVVDFSAVSNGKITTGSTATPSVNTTVKTSSTAAQNKWTTSAITFRASEDLGGGLKATATVTSGVEGGLFTARDSHINLSGGFGSVQLGRFGPAGHGASGFSGVGTTSTTGSMDHLSSAGADLLVLAGSTGSFGRQNNVIQYTSPSLNGLRVSVNYINNSSDSSAAANLNKAQTTQTGLNVAYSAGPLSIGAGTNTRKVKTEGVASGDGAFTNLKGSFDFVGARYNFGAATVFATQAKRKDTSQTGSAATANVIDAKVTAYGVQVPMGAITLAASTYSGKDKRVGTAAAATKLSGNQISLTYALSKRTQIYAVSGTSEIKRDGAASEIASRKNTATNIGLTHSF